MSKKSSLVQSVAVHNLKSDRPFFDDVVTRHKTFEIRRHDRDFKVGDRLHLSEWHDGGYTGRSCDVRVTYLSTAFAPEGFVIMSIEPWDV